MYTIDQYILLEITNT